MKSLENEALAIGSETTSLNVALKRFWEHIHSNENVKPYYRWKMYDGTCKL